jgi:hypothetical protein
MGRSNPAPAQVLAVRVGWMGVERDNLSLLVRVLEVQSFVELDGIAFTEEKIPAMLTITSNRPRHRLLLLSGFDGGALADLGHAGGAVAAFSAISVLVTAIHITLLFWA